MDDLAVYGTTTPTGTTVLLILVAETIRDMDVKSSFKKILKAVSDHAMNPFAVMGPKLATKIQAALK